MALLLDLVPGTGCEKRHFLTARASARFLCVTLGIPSVLPAASSHEKNLSYFACFSRFREMTLATLKPNMNMAKSRYVYGGGMAP